MKRFDRDTEIVQLIRDPRAIITSLAFMSKDNKNFIQYRGHNISEICDIMVKDSELEKNLPSNR